MLLFILIGSKLQYGNVPYYFKIVCCNVHTIAIYTLLSCICENAFIGPKTPKHLWIYNCIVCYSLFKLTFIKMQSVLLLDVWFIYI